MRAGKMVSVVLFIVLSSVLFAAGQAEPAESEGQKQLNLKWSGMMTPSHAWAITAEDVCAEVAKRTNGRINIEFYPAGALGSQQEGIEMLGVGDIAFLTSGPTIFSSYVPETQIFMLPYVFDDLAHVRRVVESPLIQDMFNVEILEKSGVRTIAFWYYGDRNLTTAHTPARRPEDISGLKIRAVDNPVAQNVVRALGGKPVPVAFAELYMALQTGVADGQENPVTTIYDKKFHEVQDYMIETRHNVHMGTVHVSEKVWQSLSEEDQQLLTEVFAKYSEQVDDMIISQTKERLQEMVDAGFQVIQPDRESFREHATNHIMGVYGDKWGYLLEEIDGMR